jgi:uncharacterized protein (TIGR02646 family)
MIRIRKSRNIPSVLIQQGKKATTDFCQRYDNEAANFDSGLKKFRAKRSIYAHSLVKKQLQTEQHDKCCFCEADFTANSYGDVEHFRPKGAYQITSNGELHRPGYYWLAYDWDNLFFSCQICNQRYKKNFFPLKDEASRAKNHTAVVALEEPAIINPSLDDPDQHLQFREHILIYKTLKGENSIKGFGLNRKKIKDIRKDHFDKVELNNLYFDYDPDALTDEQKRQVSSDMKRPWRELEPIIRKARAFLAVAASNKKPFAQMVRQNFPHLPCEP